MPELDAILSQKILSVKNQQRFRTLSAVKRCEGAYVEKDGRRLLAFSSNDYLGLANHPRVISAAMEAAKHYGAGSSASRLVSGNYPLYAELETSLATYKHTETALVLGSGYLANIGAIPAITGQGDLILADKLVHACILEGIKLSGAKALRFAHNDMEHAATLLTANRHLYQNCLVITETIFSMDGDKAPLAELRALCDRHDTWLMTDDAHGIGLPQTVKADIQMGTLSKALGSYGGYIAGSQILIDHIINSARSFMFSSGLPPAAVGAALEALRIIQDEPERAEKALAHARRFTQELGLPLAESPIVPIIIGAEDKALDAAQKLEEAGFLVTAIRPPTVPENTSRLRFVFTASHEKGDVTHLIKIIKNENIIS